MIKIPLKYIKYTNYNKAHTIKFKGRKEMLVRLGVQNDNFNFINVHSPILNSHNLMGRQDL